MGVENRDYMQDEPAWSPRGSARRDMVTTLIIINVVVFMVQVVNTNLGETRSILTDWFALHADKVLHGQVWRLFTYDFLHDTSGFLHIAFNMLLLFMAGRDIEQKYGSRELLWFYLSAGWAAGVFFVLWEKLVAARLPGYVSGECMGASGAVIAVLILYCLNWPHRVWHLFGVLPVPVWLIALFDVCTDVFPLLQSLGGNPPQDNIAHSAHFGGMLFAFFYYRQRWQLGELMGWLRPDLWKKRFRSRPKLRVHAPQDDPPIRKPGVTPEVESRVDQLLEKIAQHGESSLTSAEREFLAEASRRYRDRR